jgi:hypothetical protein
VRRGGGGIVRCSAEQQKAKEEGSVDQRTFVHDGDDPIERELLGRLANAKGRGLSQRAM